MKSSFVQFEVGLNELRMHVEASTLLEEAATACLAKTPTTDVEHKLMTYIENMDANSRKKRFEYNSVIISLFGIFETFVEGLLKSYLGTMRRTHNRYNQLPDFFKNHHLKLSVDLMARLSQSRFSGKTTPEVMIDNLNSCLSNKKLFSINEEPFLNHGANFREAVISEYFSRVGIYQITDRAYKIGKIQSFLDTNALEYKGFDLLDRIANIRNEIAHGETCNVEDKSFQRQYIDYVHIVGSSLFEIVEASAIQMEVEKKGKKLKNLLNVYRDEIVAFKPTPADIEFYDYLAFKDGNGKWYKEQIVSMRTESQDVRSSKKGDPRGVGIKVAGRVRKGWKFFLLPGSLPMSTSVPEANDWSKEYLDESISDEEIEVKI
ncbi:hypothetical protein GGE65_002921 [Skermanella aerolata]|uniref:MAE_28990/MAE_18760 family HEPN-like nuclease n=1 Tax=Skermanella aerolata TaxID=393310 RepID=UPI003D1CE6BA